LILEGAPYDWKIQLAVKILVENGLDMFLTVGSIPRYNTPNP
jgi:hypothetical protein